MRCLGRKGNKENFSRCKIQNAKWYFPFCRHHKWQLIILLFFTVPTYIVLISDLSQIFKPSKDLSKEYTEVHSILASHHNKQEAERLKRNQEFEQRELESKEVYQWKNPLRYSGLQNDNKNYKIITKTYEEGKLEKTKNLIIQEFKKDAWDKAVGVNESDKIKGFVVAAYFGNHEFDKAAKLVLERDKLLPKWNHSLKLDLIKCIRNYRIAKGLPSAISLVDSLKRNFDSEIISYFWTSIPFKVAYDIEGSIDKDWADEGIAGETKVNLEYLIKTYSNDPFCSYGYYLLKNPKKAIECNPKTRIIDLLNFSIGINIVDELFDKYNNDLSNKKISFYLPKPISSKTDLLKINEAISYFKAYIEQSKTSHYADDSAFWIGWLNMLIHNKEEAIIWFRKTKTLGNKVYAEYSLSYKKNNIDEFSKQLTLSDLEFEFYSNELNDNKRNSVSDYYVNVFDKLSFEEKIKFIYKNPLNTENLFFSYLEQMINLGNYENASRYFKEINKDSSKFLDQLSPLIKVKIKSLEELVTLYEDLIIEKNVKNFIQKIIKVKNEHRNFTLALICLQKVRNKKEWRLKQDFLDYLIIKIYSETSKYKVKAEVEKFELNHPQSQLLDDVLAELALVELFKLKKPQEGIQTVKKIIEEHVNDNACDNALNWLGKYYFEKCIESKYWGNDITFCNLSLETNKLIIDNYWLSTYKKVSKYRLKQSEEIIQKINSRNKIRNSP